MAVSKGLHRQLSAAKVSVTAEDELMPLCHN